MKSVHTHGYSLMEVMVTLLVLSAGLIGAAGLQLSAWQLTQQSALHTAAQQLAAEMAEWLHAVDDDLLEDFLIEKTDGPDVPVTSAMHCYGTHCSARALAAYLVDEWQGRVRAKLPDAAFTICRDAMPWDDEAATYRWACESFAGQASLVIKIGWRDKQALEQASLPVVVLSTGR